MKSWSSILTKLQRVPLSLTGLHDLQDLVGFRLVLQFRRDVDRVCGLIDQNLKIVDRYDTIARLREDQFGYGSIHFVVELPDSWLAVPTMARLAGLLAEIQVRTTVQHIWAEASQTLQYKSENAVPAALRRAIYRVSALLETVDLEFERLLTDRENYKSEAAPAAPSSEVLNVDTLEQALDAAWPPPNKESGGETYAELLADLTEFQIVTADSVKKLVSKWQTETLKEDAERVRQIGGDPELLERYPPRERERITSGVFLTHVGLTRVALAKEHPERWAAHVRNKLAKKSAK